MPRCIECGESYADHIRRCPHCGTRPSLPDSAASIAAPEQASAPAGVPTALKEWQQRRSRMLIYLSFVAVVSVVGVIGTVALDAGDDREDELFGKPKPPPVLLSAELPPSLPSGVSPDPLERSLQVDWAQADGEEMVVEGDCSAKAVVRVLVNGTPAVIDPRGTRYRAVLPYEPDIDEVEVVGEGVNGETVRRTISVSVPERSGGPHTRGVRVVSHADGQTVHADAVRLEVRALTDGAPRNPLDAGLVALENRIRVGERVVTLFRAPAGLVYLRTTAKGQRIFLREVDGREVVLIPSGLSQRGTGKGPPYGPQHVIFVGAYLIDRAEVTGGQYAAFLRYMRRVQDASLRHEDDPGGDLRPLGWSTDEPPPGAASLPVTGVSWFAAHAYTRWVGGRLPTEAEWERAATGPQGSAYPWGGEFDAARVRCRAEGPLEADSLIGGESPFSVLHMSGNVREWCADRYDPRWYLRSSRTNPRGPSKTKHRVVKGGSFASDGEALRPQHRDQSNPRESRNDIGFRVVMDWVGFSEEGDE